MVRAVNLKGLSEDSHRLTIQRVNKKLSFKGALEPPRDRQGSLLNYLHGKPSAPAAAGTS
jgi:hypothetical protein